MRKILGRVRDFILQNLAPDGAGILNRPGSDSVTVNGPLALPIGESILYSTR